MWNIDPYEWLGVSEVKFIMYGFRVRTRLHYLSVVMLATVTRASSKYNADYFVCAPISKIVENFLLRY